VHVGRLAAGDVAAALRDADAGLSFVKPCVSKLASSPTKIGEYLAIGLPVVSTTGIGDIDQLLSGCRFGWGQVRGCATGRIERHRVSACCRSFVSSMGGTGSYRTLSARRRAQFGLGASGMDTIPRRL